MTLQDSIRHFATPDGLTLAYSDIGSGVPLLCLAGLTRNMDDFEPVLSFADRARIIRLDSRGRGRSDFDPEWRNYNVLQESNDALALLDHLGIEKTAILGTSRGGLIAMTLAVGHKERLLGVMLNDIGPMIEPAGLAYIFGYLGNRPDFKDFDDAAEKLSKTMAERFSGVPRETWKVFARRVWRQAEDGLDLRYDPHLRTAVLEQSASDTMPDLWPVYRALEGLPLALLRGGNSDLLSAETASKMKEMHPELEVTVIPGRGHVPFLDEPESQAAIASFLDRLS